MTLSSDILRNNRTFAVVGVSQDTSKYGYQIFRALLKKGYRVYPLNPKYVSVDWERCYPSLDDLPEVPQVVVPVVPPAVTEQVVESCVRLGIRTVWMPPGAWSKEAVAMCDTHNIEEVHDVCLLEALRSM